MVWDLGRLIFTSTELPGKGYAHRWRHMRKGSLDHWYVTIPFCRSGVGPGRLTTEPPSLHCLAKPFEAETDSDGLLTLYMPRDLFPAMSAFDTMLDLKLDGGRGLLLSDYLVLLERSLTGLTLAELPHVVEATRCLIAACLLHREIGWPSAKADRHDRDGASPEIHWPQAGRSGPDTGDTLRGTGRIAFPPLPAL